MRFLSLTAVLILSAGLASSASASEIYKWTDAEGNVHYTDKPIDPSYEHVAIVSRPTDNARVQAQTQARLERKATAAEEAANAPEGPTRDELRAEAEERAQKCSMYQERVIRFEQAHRLYRADESGERVYLDDSEIDEARQKAQDQANEFCKS